ncbi:hypothetical protein ZEAMMB73_Zm00001d012713 [Zea mays]|nr:hypothetical protein ZEAMMB73_Zm00001d012713 [Zea mays]
MWYAHGTSIQTSVKYMCSTTVCKGYQQLSSSYYDILSQKRKSRFLNPLKLKTRLWKSYLR